MKHLLFIIACIFTLAFNNVVAMNPKDDSLSSVSANSESVVENYTYDATNTNENKHGMTFLSTTGYIVINIQNTTVFPENPSTAPSSELSTKVKVTINIFPSDKVKEEEISLGKNGYKTVMYQVPEVPGQPTQPTSFSTEVQLKSENSSIKVEYIYTDHFKAGLNQQITDEK